jgi:hypothetical protein
MFNKEYQLIMRVVLQLPKGSFGTFTSEDKKVGYSSDYTGHHIAIFEATLRSPPVFAMIDNTYEQFVNQHRLNFKNWRLVDFDNYMKGNPFYSEFVTADTWIKRNENTWSSSKMNVPVNDDEDLKPFMGIVTEI